MKQLVSFVLLFVSSLALAGELYGPPALVARDLTNDLKARAIPCDGKPQGMRVACYLVGHDNPTYVRNRITQFVWLRRGIVSQKWAEQAKNTRLALYFFRDFDTNYMAVTVGTVRANQQLVQIATAR